MVDVENTIVAPPVRLLVLCARTEVTAAERDRIQHTAAAIEDWPSVTRLATEHGVLPLVGHTLKQAVPGGVPEEILRFLSKVAFSVAARNLMQLRELERVTRLLEEQEIPVLSFKGPLLAQVAYRNLGLRVSGDLDILVPPRAFADAERVLVQNGYRPARPVMGRSGAGRAIKLKLARQITFVRDQPRIHLDVHTGVMPPGYPYRFRFSDLSAYTAPVTVSGLCFRSFRPAELLQILCLHGVKNRWEVLKHGCDVAELLRAHPELNWEAVLARARGMRGERVLHSGVLLADRLLGAPVPEEVVRQAEQDATVCRLVERLIAHLSGGRVQTVGFAERLRFQLRVQDTPATKGRYLLYALARRLTPTP